MKENKLIAEFMNMKYSDKRSFNNGEWTYSIESLNKFKTSWDWLIPVVQKIEQVNEGVPSELWDVSLYSYQEEIYDAVVEFIKEYNKES